MLSQEENELLTRTGPGTPCGDLMRRYWQPAALSEELPIDGPPLPVRLFSEDLVLFRDQDGRPGLLGIHCSHRGADLSYGRLENGGLRCIYHGWLYDVQGRCLEQPSEPLGSTFNKRIRHPAYPCAEVGGIIFTYMGPGDPPQLPPYEFVQAPIEYRSNTKIFQDCNYLQGNDGNQDPAHLSFLHQQASDDPNSAQSLNARSRSPIIEAEDTDYGVRVYCIRNVGGGQNYVRVTNFVLPNLSAVTGTADGYQSLWHVPIDDTHHWRYIMRFSRTRPIAQGSRVRGDAAEVTGDHRLVRNKANRYLQDRESMRTWSYCGLGADFLPHDTAATEGAGPIQDRTQEHLGYTDRGIIASHQRLLEAIQAVQAGGEAPAVVRDPHVRWDPEVIARSDVLLPESVDWHNYWKSDTLEKQLATVTPG